MPFFRVSGLVTAKRKRADGLIHFSVQCTSLIEVDENNCVDSSLPMEDLSSRCIQLVHYPSTNLTPKYFSDSVIMSLASSQSVVEGYGKQMEREAEHRITINLSSLQVIRIAPNPFQIKLVLDLARQDHVKTSLVTMNYLNEIITPCYTEGITPNYLGSLVTNETSVKSHCHLLTDYSASKSRSITRKTEVSNFRAPRRRVRKVTVDERTAIDDLCQIANDRLRAIECVHNIKIECGDVESNCFDECIDNAKISTPCTEVEEEESLRRSLVLNVPDDEPSLKSRRGILTRGEYIHGKKKPQVEWIVERLFRLIGSSSSSSSKSGTSENHVCWKPTNKLNILDVGGGRGDLAVGIALELKRRRFTNSKVFVVDLNGKSLTAGHIYAEQLEVSEWIEFLELDFADALRGPDTNEGSAMISKYLPVCQYVVALHACGSLSDMALSYAAMWKAAFCIVPCCFSKTNPDISASMWCAAIEGCTEDTRSGDASQVFSSKTFRFSEGCVDKVRMLGRLAESEPRECSWRTMRGINILRLCGVCATDPLRPFSREADLKNEGISDVHSRCVHRWNMGLEYFPRVFSLRNMVLIGSLCTCSPDLETQIHVAGEHWKRYYSTFSTADKPPREMLMKVLQEFDDAEKSHGASQFSRRALDIGCGSGRDSLFLASLGWRVLAIDPDEHAVQVLLDVLSAEGQEAAIECRICSAEDFFASEGSTMFDLVNASYVLSFCDNVPMLIDSIAKHLVPGGKFAGNIFGINDSWAGDGNQFTKSFFTRDEAETLFGTHFLLLWFEESEYDGSSYVGDKHWHVFDFVAIKV